MMYIGIDLGTSGIKAILLNEQGLVLALHNEPLTISRPHPLWSEQHPEAWITATDKALHSLGQQHSLREVAAIGLTGQMHGATLLDNQNRSIRPAILWNDGRCEQECKVLAQRVPTARQITGNLMMTGFTAPKLLWLQHHEPEHFKQIHKVLLPKDYLRWYLCGEYASDMSDASGTMWLNVAKRQWDDELINACGLQQRHLPNLFEGPQITGQLHSHLASRWCMPRVPIIAGGGDNAAGAIGVSLYKQGQAMLSLGTSGVYFAVSDHYLANPSSAVHSFCHAIPNTWHLMSVMLSAASCVDWVTKLTNIPRQQLLDQAERRQHSTPSLSFLPYLSGERTPHNNPYATGVFYGLTHQHDAVDMMLAVLQGVGFALTDGMQALHQTGLVPDEVTLIGGGAQNTFWRQMLADISGKTLDYRDGGHVGPALGAAKLAQIGLHPALPFSELLTPLPLLQRHEPDREQHARYQEQLRIFRQLYQYLSPLMTAH